MNTIALLVVAALCAAPAQAPRAPAAPQPGHPGAAPPGPPAALGPAHHPGPEDGLHSQLFPPELIMGQQSEIGLTKQQRTQLVKEIQASQSAIVELQFELKAAEGTLVELVKADRVDERRALGQADRLMAMEAKIKREHLRLLLRIKNILTPEQQARLRELRPPLPPPAPPQPPQPPQPPPPGR